MKDEEYNKHMKVFDSYIEVKRQSLSDSVGSMVDSFTEKYLEELRVQEKIDERNDKIDKILSDD